MLPEMEENEISNLQVLHNTVLIEVLWEEKKTKGGILLTKNFENINEKYYRGKIKAISQSIKQDDFKVGDIVWFNKYNLQGLDKNHIITDVKNIGCIEKQEI